VGGKVSAINPSLFQSRPSFLQILSSMEERIRGKVLSLDWKREGLMDLVLPVPWHRKYQITPMQCD